MPAVKNKQGPKIKDGPFKGFTQSQLNKTPARVKARLRDSFEKEQATAKMRKFRQRGPLGKLMHIGDMF